MDELWGDNTAPPTHGQAPFDACESFDSQPHGCSEQKQSENHFVGVFNADLPLLLLGFVV